MRLPGPLPMSIQAGCLAGSHKALLVRFESSYWHSEFEATQIAYSVGDAQVVEWQTQRIQTPPPKACEFDSRLGHMEKTKTGGA